MKVNLTKAAKMVGISRPTLYSHIESKNITVEQTEDGKLIDVSELTRVYGDKLQMPREDGLVHDNDDNASVKMRKSEASSITRIDKMEIEFLKERIKHLEADKAFATEERRQEREMLLERLEKSEEQQKRLTLLLTDQTRKGEDKNIMENQRIESLERKLSILRKDNAVIVKALRDEKQKSFFQKLFGK